MMIGTEMRSYGAFWVEGVTQGRISKKALSQLRALGLKRGYRVTVKPLDNTGWREIGPNVSSAVRGKVPLYYWIKE